MALTDPPRYWIEEGIPEGDAGRVAIVDDPVAMRMLAPCRGCGEHRCVPDEEWHAMTLLDRHYCSRCQVRLEAEAAAERSLLQ